VIVSVTLIMTVFYIAINLILDILQAFIDPRVIIG
jgi:ABC-type dipeptide/oligopeptide/nickel transport system permease component